MSRCIFLQRPLWKAIILFVCTGWLLR